MIYIYICMYVCVCVCVCVWWSKKNKKVKNIQQQLLEMSANHLKKCYGPIYFRAHLPSGYRRQDSNLAVLCGCQTRYCTLREEHNSLVAESSMLGKIYLCLHKKIKISVSQGCYTVREVMTNTDYLNSTRALKFRSCDGLGLWLGFRTKKSVQNFHR